VLVTGRPCRIDPGGVLFMEVYSNARTWSDVSRWHLDVMAYGDADPCPAGRLEYPRPYGRPMPNACVRYDAVPARVDLDIGAGAGAERHEPPGRWP
jgi:hypothetical protein